MSGTYFTSYISLLRWILKPWIRYQKTRREKFYKTSVNKFLMICIVIFSQTQTEQPTNTGIIVEHVTLLLAHPVYDMV
jgi:hypothetical protein